MPPPGVVALVAVGIGVGTLVAGVHEMQKNERKVIMEFFAVLLLVCLALLSCAGAQTMRQAVLRDIEKLGR